MNKVCSIYLKLNTLCHQTCIQNPCKNGGICVNIPSYNLIYTFTYKCICSNEYEGKHCETHNGNMSTIQEDSKHLISKKSHHMFENKTIDFNLQVTLNMEFIIKYYTLNDNETINFIKTLETILSDIHKEEVIVTYLRAGSVIVDYTMKDVLVTGQKIVNYTTTIQNFIKTQKIIVVNGNIVNITDAKLFIQTEDYSINLENTNNLCLLYKITNQCKNNSTCQLTDTMAHCVCFPGYTGEFCDKISTEDFHKNKTHTNSISNRNMFIIFGFVCAAVLLIICIIMICKFKKQANRFLAFSQVFFYRVFQPLIQITLYILSGTFNFASLLIELIDYPLIYKIEKECRQIRNIHWDSTFLNDTEFFWKHVGAYKNAVDNRPFLTVSQFLLKVYCLPISNATVEIIFFKVTHIKSLKNNKLSLDKLSSLIRIKNHFEVSSILCENFEPPLEMMFYDSYIYEDEDVDMNTESIVEIYFSSASS
ncbi:hypothetical protein A3Q56_06436 [Intoshia linei]|uniref:EGF-like domain-containing protein n=1 Tax=Intoshia linei TaxID=1819745 RepID=A0A177AWC4_9BILA|nr:hypothetical protein A3Q56_06436 [Intoshia linei]